jgi:hypothetical protein
MTATPRIAAAYAAFIPFPADMQAASNTVEVIFSTTQGSNGRCDRGPELVAEMLPTTRLLAGDARYSDPLTEVRQALSEIGVLGLGASDLLGAADADAASNLLAQLIPRSARLRPDATKAVVVVVAPQSVGFDLPEAGPIWLVTLDTTTRRPLVEQLQPGAQLPPSGLAVLIVPDSIDTTRVAL